jgi:hypothetical protein
MLAGKGLTWPRPGVIGGIGEALEIGVADVTRRCKSIKNLKVHDDQSEMKWVTPQ